MRLKIFFRRTALCTAFFLLNLPAQHAKAQFEDAIKQLTSDNAKGYLQPFVTSFGANMNSGLYHSADIGDGGLTVRLDIIGMGTLIGDEEKSYNAAPPFPFDQSPVNTATVFGGEGTTVFKLIGSDTLEYQMQNGQVKTSIVPLAVPQLTVGDFMGTQCVIRFVPLPEMGDFPKVTLFGLGVRHKVSRYIPAIPVHIAASLFYQSLDIGDIFEAKSFNLGVQISKSFSLLTLYGGLQYESSSMDVSYDYEGTYGIPTGTPINLAMEGENNFRLTAGTALNLAFFNLYADINIGTVTMVSGGLGFGF